LPTVGFLDLGGAWFQLWCNLLVNSFAGKAGYGRVVKKALRESKGSIKQASQKLGISYKTLQYRIKKHGLDRRDFK
jgi:molybdenum-dependent DNA-binding transcriptional regulator ModE